MITNIPTKKFSDPKVQILRRGAEYRALFLYHILKALKDHGYEFEMIGREGIFALGRSNSAGFPDTDIPEVFTDTLLEPPGASSMQIERTVLSEKEAKLEFGYCPMCELWQKVTDDQDMIALLCDIAMEVDRGLVDTYPEFTLRLGKRISAGEAVCDFWIRKK